MLGPDFALGPDFVLGLDCVLGPDFKKVFYDKSRNKASKIRISMDPTIIFEH